MNQDTWKRLEEEFKEFPMMRSDETPDLEEVDIASKAIGVSFIQDYKEFLLRFGSATVGPYPIFGLRPSELMGANRWSVVDLTTQLRQSKLDGTEKWIMVSEDHSGNPIGMDSTGKIWIFDHDFGGISELADSFEQYLRHFCLKL